MSLTKRWLESQAEARTETLDSITRSIRYAARIIGADQPLDWQDRAQAERALYDALTALESLKQDECAPYYSEAA